MYCHAEFVGALSPAAILEEVKKTPVVVPPRPKAKKATPPVVFEETPFVKGPMPIVIPVVVAGAIITVLLGGGSLGTEIKVLCAIAPGLFIIERLVRSDRFPEPAALILVAFACGAASSFAAGAAEGFLERVSREFFENHQAWLTSDFYRAFVGAGVCEETVKYLILTLLCLRWHAFDEPIDGMVYGITVSLGFAAMENVFYVLHESSSSASLGVALLRALTAVPSHAAGGAVMGFFVGLSRGRRSGRLLLLALAWAAPVALHGAYDFFLFVNKRMDVGIGRLWFWLFVYEIDLARRMLRKLQEVQRGASAEELVQQVRRRLGLSEDRARDRR
jgi:RsiW-degrading membrane proteinase PrsW (M82 family)